LYENALVIELTLRGHTVEQQRDFPVHYRGHFIGRLLPDLIVDGLIIVDPKVVTAFNDTHIAQMLGYLNISGLEVALLLNFKDSKLDWKACGQIIHSLSVPSVLSVVNSLSEWSRDLTTDDTDITDSDSKKKCGVV